MPSKETPKRLTPTKNTLRDLYLKSGNLCAFPDCKSLMIDSDGTYIGQICHIEAAEAGGERFNPNMNNEERRHSSNLMLMCYPHHAKTNDVSKFTVEALKKMKRDHEDKFSNPEKLFLKDFGDQTDSIAGTLPTTLNGWIEVFGKDDDKDELIRIIANFRNKIVNVPLNTRKFLGVLSKRAYKTKVKTIAGKESIIIPIDDLQEALGLDQKELKKQISIIDTHSLGCVDVDDYPQSLHLFGQTYFSLWLIIAEFCEKKSIDIDRFLVDLEFDRFD